ncbi:hypothetical protein L5G32_03030 [Gordonia sp. HY002]|uniref:hypothetical protein n=1 Tax=Gordonia zhenghanii TaxID=2911516 RepID=UPI001F46AB0C|nr:hypothetical protein [Gordonia zhenghanii]MCF8569241.1 hypothetical protein [Gordonia zhenghanii]
MLYLISALLTALICGPLFPGFLVYRDAVSVPQFSLSAAAFGIDGSAPRAVPQDAFLGLASRVVDGGWVLALLTTAAVFGAGVGYGLLARRLVPHAGTAGAVVAAVVGIWNPFVAERLLQGHWSLLIGYASLGPIVLAVLNLARERSLRPILILVGLFAVAGFTPTGSILALAVAAVTAIAVRPGLRTTLLCLVGWVVTASPWLVAAAVSDSAGSSGGASAFALRSEPGLGSLGTALGLGGIWNADAVPGSRSSWWAAVATVVFLAVVAAGAFALLRERREPTGPVLALGLLAVTVVLLVTLASTGPGLSVMDALMTHVPGAGLLRDAQKYLALAAPFTAIACAAAVGALRRLVPGGFAAAAVGLLIVAPLPDLAWGVGGHVRSIEIPADYAEVTEAIGDGGGTSVALWPTETVRNLSWTHGPSLSVLPRMIDAPVMVDGTLIVDGEPLDAPTGRTADVVTALDAGGDPAALAALGVGWVVSEESSAPPQLAAHADEVVTTNHLRLFAIPGAAPAPSPSTSTWIAAITALAVWFAALVSGAIAATLYRFRRFQPS